MRTYLFTYRYDGAEYSLEVPADSLDEAKGRVSQMGLARHEGEVFVKIPIGGGLFSRLCVAVASWWRFVARGH